MHQAVFFPKADVPLTKRGGRAVEKAQTRCGRHKQTAVYHQRQKSSLLYGVGKGRRSICMSLGWWSPGSVSLASTSRFFPKLVDTHTQRHQDGRKAPPPEAAGDESRASPSPSPRGHRSARATAHPRAPSWLLTSPLPRPSLWLSWKQNHYTGKTEGDAALEGHGCLPDVLATSGSMRG